MTDQSFRRRMMFMFNAVDIYINATLAMPWKATNISSQIQSDLSSLIKSLIDINVNVEIQRSDDIIIHKRTMDLWYAFLLHTCRVLLLQLCDMLRYG